MTEHSEPKETFLSQDCVVFCAEGVWKCLELVSTELGWGKFHTRFSKPWWPFPTWLSTLQIVVCSWPTDQGAWKAKHSLPLTDGSSLWILPRIVTGAGHPRILCSVFSWRILPRVLLLLCVTAARRPLRTSCAWRALTGCVLVDCSTEHYLPHPPSSKWKFLGRHPCHKPFPKKQCQGQQGACWAYSSRASLPGSRPGSPWWPIST